MRSITEVLEYHIQGYEGWLHGCVQDDGDGPYFRRDLWPTADLGPAPTDAQIEAWRNA